MRYVEEDKVYELTNEELQILIDSVFDVELDNDPIIPTDDEIDDDIECNMDDPFMLLYVLWIVYAGPYIPAERKKDFDKLKRLADNYIRIID